MKIAIALFAVFIAGCTIEVEEKSPVKNDSDIAWEIQSQNCIDAGGVPIRSAWDRELKTCQWPPPFINPRASVEGEK